MIRDCEIIDNVKIHNPDLVNLYECTILNETQIAAFVEIGRNVIIGRNCRIGMGAFICEGVQIKDNVFIGPRVCFTNDFNPTVDNPSWQAELTVVESGASIGANATVVCGVRIGANALIGAGSVVTKDIPPNEVWVGNPARFLRYRDAAD